jgi:hypothetical protein
VVLFSVALQKEAVFLILLNSPGLLRKPPGRAEKPLKLSAPVFGEVQSPVPAVLFPVDFILPPAVVLCIAVPDVSAPECIDIINLFQSESVGTCQPVGQIFL